MSWERARAWVGAAGVLLLGMLLTWYHLARRDRTSARFAAAQATEEAAAKTLSTLQDRLDTLKRMGDSNHSEIVRLEETVAKRKEALRAKFTRQGLTAGDIATRFKRLRL